MSANNRNRLKTTVSAVASSGLGAFTISTASSGYRSFVAGDDGLTFDGVLITEGNAWEVRDGCVYTHSGTSLSRGTLMDSSTGSAIAFTSAAVVSQGGAADFARRAESAGLRTSISSSNANLTMQVGVLHCVDISGFTADRTATLPAVAAVDDRVGLYISTGDDAYEMLVTAASGDTLAGVAGGTEWNRLFITGEFVVFRCTVANTTWVVESFEKIKAWCKISRTTAQAITTGTNTKVACATSVSDLYGMADVVTNNRITVRRAGDYLAEIFTAIGALADQYRTVGRVYKNGSLDSSTPTSYISTAGSVTGAAQGTFELHGLAAGDYIELWVYWDGTTGTKDTGTGGNSCTLLVKEK